MIVLLASVGGNIGGGDLLLFVWIFLGVLLVAWLGSLWFNPWRHCSACNSVPRTYGKLFTGGFRICGKCGGNGRQKRFMADIFARNRAL